MPNNTPDNMGTRPTAAGLALLAKAIAGSQLTFTRGAFGDSYRNGAFVDPTIAEQTALTTLINERLSLPIADISSDAGNAKVELLVRNAQLQTTFQVREVGLFARDPDTQAEVLYCYIHYGEGGFIMLAGTTSVVIELFYQLTTAVSGASNVTAVVDRSSLYTTLNRFLEHVNATNPHPNQIIPSQYELPTAGATVKGGAKVNDRTDGLFMDGDTLKAVPVDLSAINTAISNIAASIGAFNLTLGNHADSISALDVRVYNLEHPPEPESEEVTLTLNTTYGQESNFVLTGAASLTAGGFFTLSN